MGVRGGVVFAAALFVSALVRAAHAGEQPEPQPSQVIFQINENYGSWTSDANPKKEGGQNLAYLNFTYMTDSYGVTLLGSHSDTTYTYNDPSKTDFQLSTLMDSTLSTYYVPPKLLDLSVRLGVDFNLPTGHASFTNGELSSLMIDGVSKDLITMPSFGKGFNIAPNLIVSHPLGNSVLGLGVRYEVTGEYNPASEVSDKTYDPGDSLTVFGSMQYNITPHDQLVVDLSTMLSTRDKQGGMEVMKQGTAYNLGLRYVQTSDTIKMTYATTYGWQEKNQTYDAGGMTTEDRNTNNNRYELLVTGAYIYSAEFMLNGTAGYKNTIANGWDSADPLYDAGYAKGYVGAGGTYAISNNKFVTFDLKGFQVWNGKDSLEPDAAIYRGFNVDIGFVYSWGAAPPPAASDPDEKVEGVVPIASPETPVAPAPAPMPEKPAAMPALAPAEKPVEPVIVTQREKPAEKPAAPAGVTAVPGDGKLTIRWQAVAGAETYHIHWSTVPGLTGRNGEQIHGINSTEYELSGLQNGVGYYYAVSAANKAGESPVSIQLFGMPRPDAPSAPTGLIATGGNKTVSLRWSKVPGADAYRIYRSTAPPEGALKEGWQKAGWLSVVSTAQFVDRAAVNGETYYYVVAATNISGEGDLSEIVTATPQIAPPAPPRSLSAVVSSDGVVLNWDTVAGAVSYNIYRSTVPGKNGKFIAFTTSTTYLDTILEPGSVYYYVIRSKNRGGRSAPSPQVGILAGDGTAGKGGTAGGTAKGKKGFEMPVPGKN